VCAFKPQGQTEFKYEEAAEVMGVMVAEGTLRAKSYPSLMN
jgi:hypothetical protein